MLHAKVMTVDGLVATSARPTSTRGRVGRGGQPRRARPADRGDPRPAVRRGPRTERTGGPGRAGSAGPGSSGCSRPPSSRFAATPDAPDAGRPAGRSARDLQLGLVDAARLHRVDLLGDLHELARGLGLGVGHDDRGAGVATLAQRRHQRHPPEQGDPDACGQRLAAATAEDLVRDAVVAPEPAHVLDHADDVELDLLGHRGGALRDRLRGRLRRGDDHDLGARQELAHRERDVARARWHVDDEVVGLVPGHVGEELLERLVEHRPPPDDRLVLGDEEAHGEQPDPVARRRDHAVVLGELGPVLDAEHPGHGEAPDVRVDRGDVLAHPGERHRQIRGDRRLADAALARGDGDHPGPGVRERVLSGHRHSSSPPFRGSSGRSATFPLRA